MQKQDGNDVDPAKLMDGVCIQNARNLEEQMKIIVREQTFFIVICFVLFLACFLVCCFKTLVCCRRFWFLLFCPPLPVLYIWYDSAKLLHCIKLLSCLMVDSKNYMCVYSMCLDKIARYVRACVHALLVESTDSSALHTSFVFQSFCFFLLCCVFDVATSRFLPTIST